ncbi:thiamine-phosphate kinase [Lentibacillus halodurans]|uniref:Thiamine-monophosphate kinase n=1 Tax=Lentibacillus halodurans TaxID=237679 RepID=A0A1I1AKN0_9BACI|nr:thiamine-phosphate kinase [Lentibacillus halodurans]SFB38052.1 thiamine-phosphate kinase [Lentibacillus halodurans]
MNEFAFIDAIKQHAYKQPSVMKGIGDDAAVFRQPSQDIITAVDTFVEDVHFSRSTMTPFQIGYRSLAANISDLSAMGASPAFYLVSVVIPQSWRDEELIRLYKGMAELAMAYHMDLIGGDTVSGKALSLSITVIGYVNRDKARYRSTAKSGDIVFVTGTLGDSAAGFHMLNNPNDYKDQAYYYRRHRMPTMRNDFASGLELLPRITLNDISDGIASEANEIAEASNVSLTIYEEKIPVSENFYQFSKEQQYKWKLYGGEDFELLGTVPKDGWDSLKEVADRTSTPVTEIGVVTEDRNQGHHVALVDRNHTKKQLEKKGYTHRSG